MKIIEPGMQVKMARVLRDAGGLHSLDDIEAALLCGDMQGHTAGNTWAITQVQKYPRFKVVHVLYLVGFQEDIKVLEDKIVAFAKDVGAKRITAVGRDGWWKFHTPGWAKTGVSYAKEL